MAQLVELPSGLILNLDLVVSISDAGETGNEKDHFPYTALTLDRVKDGEWPLTEDDYEYIKKRWVIPYDIEILNPLPTDPYWKKH